jgi:short-subunit dehydrogenase
VLVEELDVTKPVTIESAIAKGIEAFGKIDVLINNAGFGMMGPLEASSDELMNRIFDVNVFGVIRTTKAMLPHFRANKEGLIVNVSSIVGRACFPYQTLYHSTKHALEGLTEGSQYELKPFGIHVKLVEPGGVATEFVNNISMTGDDGIDDYKPGMDKYFGTIQNMLGSLSTSDSIAQVVYTATMDGTDRLRYLAGADAEQVMGARQQMDDKAFYEMMAGQFDLL